MENKEIFKTFKFRKKDFIKTYNMAYDLYNLSNVLYEFCISKKDCEDIGYIVPLTKYIYNLADDVNYFFAQVDLGFEELD